MDPAVESKPLSASLHGLLAVLIGAYPDALYRENVCGALGTSREALRQKLRRLQLALGPGAVETLEDRISLTAHGFETSRGRAIPSQTLAAQDVSHDPKSIAIQLRDVLLSLAPMAKDEARAMLVHQAWITRALPMTELGQLLEATRPANQQSPFSGEWKNLETLILYLQGAHRDIILRRVDCTKKIAQRNSQRSVYRRAHLLGTFIKAGETALAPVEILSKASLLALPAYDKLAYLSRLTLEFREEHTVRASEWVAEQIDRESEADRSHFWRNATSLNLFASGRALAHEAREFTRASKLFSVDYDSKRCVLVSTARECLLRFDPIGAEQAARAYQDLSEQMSWTWHDALEIRARSSQLRGDFRASRTHRDTLVCHLQRSGHDQKRLHREIIAQIDAGLP